MEQDQTKVAAADAARQKASESRKSATDAGGNNPELNSAADAAESEATKLEDAAKAPSHDTKPEHKERFTKVEKINKRIEILNAEKRKELLAAGVNPEDIDDRIAESADNDEESEPDDDKPLTMGDLKRIEARNATKTADQMADAIEDTEVRSAVKDALKNRVAKGGTPEQRYADALAIVNAPRNTRIASEANRFINRPNVRHTGGGAPARADSEADFTPTAIEASLMKIGKLSKDDVIKARQAAQDAFGGRK